jgi:hypothetical protein
LFFRPFFSIYQIILSDIYVAYFFLMNVHWHINTIGRHKMPYNCSAITGKVTESCLTTLSNTQNRKFKHTITIVRKESKSFLAEIEEIWIRLILLRCLLMIIIMTDMRIDALIIQSMSICKWKCIRLIVWIQRMSFVSFFYLTFCLKYRIRWHL